jgi:hypothetical protein
VWTSDSTSALLLLFSIIFQYGMPFIHAFADRLPNVTGDLQSLEHKFSHE